MSYHRSAFLAFTALALVLSAPGLAQAEEATAGASSYPRLTIDLPIEIQNDYTSDTTPSTNEVNKMFATIEPYMALKLNEHLSSGNR